MDDFASWLAGLNLTIQDCKKERSFMKKHVAYMKPKNGCKQKWTSFGLQEKQIGVKLKNAI